MSQANKKNDSSTISDNDNANVVHSEVVQEQPQVESQPDAPQEQSDDGLDKIAELEQQVNELKDQLLRSMAEKENIRARHRKELDEANKYGLSRLAKDMLNVQENLERTIQAISQDDLQNDAKLKSLYEGVELTNKELLNTFKNYNIVPINVQLGEKFDHNLHQAMVQIETNDFPAGHIAQIMQNGYTINERLLRPVLVGVAKIKKVDEKDNLEDNSVNN